MIVFGTTSAYASDDIFVVTPDYPNIIRSIDGVLEDGRNVEDLCRNVENTEINESEELASVIYEYVPGKERIINKQLELRFGMIHETYVTAVEGTSASYTITRERSLSKSTAWNISGSAEGSFDISAIQGKIAANSGYSSTKTAVIKVNETWNGQTTAPGTYQFAWYMVGHKYTAQCGAIKRTTGSNDGTPCYYTLGTVTFPTDVVHFETKRVYF